MHKQKSNAKPNSMDVYLERRKSRDYVGRLLRPKEGRGFKFKYNENYLLKKNAIPLGPEFPLLKKVFFSNKLFETFIDRIPSRENPAFPDYCRSAGISPNETDYLELLMTIGRKGPSSFIFEPVKERLFTGREITDFRKELGLTLREFAAAFGMSPTSVQKLEAGTVSGRELLKRFEIYRHFPDVALYEIQKNRPKLHAERYQVAVTRLKAKII